MTLFEVALWSACLGVFVLCFVVALAQAVIVRSVIGLQVAGFVAVLGLYVATRVGLLAAFPYGLESQVLKNLVLMSGVMATCIATLGLRQFLRAHQHDAVTQISLLVMTGVSALSIFAVFWPHYSQALQWVMGVELVAAFLSLVLSLRAYWRGDRFARYMAWGCVGLILALVGNNAMALRAIDGNLLLQGVAAVGIVSFMVGSASAIWQRNTEYFRMRRALSLHQEKDLLTQLWTGNALAQRVEKTISRARRNRSETAVVCVQILNAVDIRKEHGDNAADQLVYKFAARVRRNAGANTEVGRYNDNSFVVMIENVKQPRVLRTLGQSLSASVRGPFVLHAKNAPPFDVRAEVGIGIVRLAGGGHISNISAMGDKIAFSPDGLGAARAALHDAGELALAGQKMPTKVAILDAYSRKAIDIEEADL